MIAHVSIYKEVERDNWTNGCTGSRNLLFNENITIDFENTNDLKEKLYMYASGIFDIPNGEMFMEYLSNDYENNCFDYSQNEDNDEMMIQLSEKNPDGWFVEYIFYINKVTQEIKYKFD